VDLGDGGGEEGEGLVRPGDAGEGDEGEGVLAVGAPGVGAGAAADPAFEHLREVEGEALDLLLNAQGVAAFEDRG
jgi:hypothetical protein